jgi:hypothetical protein
MWLARCAVAIAAAGLAGCSTHPAGPGPASSSTSTVGAPATEILDAVAVDSNGRPVNGYHETAGGQTVPDQADCTEPSPAAVAKNIYRCWPAYYAADVCWPASGLELLCMNDPWAKELHRIRSRAPLAPMSPPDLPKPMALLLDDGTHCRLRNGGAWGHRYDNLQAFYGCGDHPGLDVLAPADADPINRSLPVWTVKVGSDEAQDPSSPPPITRRVQIAWFAGD